MSSAELRKLKWRCRRGALELDILLGRYLDRCYERAGPGERETFLSLLELEDSELLRYLTGSARPETEALAELVEKIRRLDV